MGPNDCSRKMRLTRRVSAVLMLGLIVAGVFEGNGHFAIEHSLIDVVESAAHISAELVQRWSKIA